MAPEGLKIGDTFEEVDGKRTFIQLITGIDDYGRYISKCIGLKGSEIVVPVEDVIQEELPFTMPDDELVETETTEEETEESTEEESEEETAETETVEEQPIVEEVKKEKAAPKKTAKKKSTAKKTSKK